MLKQQNIVQQKNWYSNAEFVNQISSRAAATEWEGKAGKGDMG